MCGPPHIKPTSARPGATTTFGDRTNALARELNVAALGMNMTV